MESGYFTNSLGMAPAGSLLGQPCNVATNQQYYYYEPSTDYLLTPSLPSTTSTQAIVYSVNEATAAAATVNHFDLAVSTSQFVDFGQQQSVYSATFQPDSIEYGGAPFHSSVFLSPQASAPSSAAQSPQAEVVQTDSVLDLPLDDLFNVDDILNDESLITDELLDVLNDVGCSDFLSQLEFTGQAMDSESCFTSDSSASSTPKRKYSSDSSDCYSLASFSDSTTSSVAAADCKPKPKRARRTKVSKEEKVARKKDQNKKAASRYRDKKKTEVQCNTGLLEQMESQRDGLSEQLKKLQTEFNVILPLAKAAFAFDPVRSQHLSQLLTRVSGLL